MVKAETREMSAYTVIYQTRDGRILSKPLGNEKKFVDAAKHAEKMILRGETTILALCRDKDANSLIEHFNGQCASMSKNQPLDKAREYPFDHLPSALIRRVDVR